MRRLSHVSLILALSVVVLAPAAAGSAPACAAEVSGSPHAALVVGTGGDTTTYCVALDSSNVSGIHLIQLAGSQFGLQYRLGFGGQAVCQLAGVGPSGGDCFADYPDFWGYWHGDGHGGWSWAGSGAASASIGQGDMEGWVYGSGDSGSTHAAPPALAFDDVCEDATPSPTPTPNPPPGGGGDGGSGGGGSGGGAGDGGTIEGDTTGNDAATSGEDDGSGTSSNSGDDDSDRSEGDDREPSPTGAPTSTITSATPITALAGSVTDEQGGGPPLGALFAVIAVAVLGVGGWFLRRRQIAVGGD